MGVVWMDRRNGSTRGRQGALTPLALLSPAKDADETSSHRGEATALYTHSAASLAALRRITRRARRHLNLHPPGA